ncbi:hypothetical protein [Cohnella faecalis]|nr:hypothetical protein [Cohnella faecalis]
MTRAILAASPAIEEYRVVQQGGEELEIELLTAAESDREEVERQVSASIGALMRRLNCRIPNLAFAAYSYKPGLRKLRRVERRWQIEHSHLPL